MNGCGIRWGVIMGKKKTTQQQTQNYNNTNTYGWQQMPDTADIAALRDFQFTADPSIGYTYGNARNQLANSFNNPLGGNYSPQMRDQIQRSGNADLAQREGQARSEANQGLQSLRFGQRAAVAGMSAPRLVQTGGSGTSSANGTTTQSGGMLGDILTGFAMGAGQGTGAAA